MYKEGVIWRDDARSEWDIQLINDDNRVYYERIRCCPFEWRDSMMNPGCFLFEIRDWAEDVADKLKSQKTHKE